MRHLTWFAALLALCGWMFVSSTSAWAHPGTDGTVTDCEEDLGDDGDDAGRILDCEDHDDDGDDSGRVLDCEDEDGDDAGRAILGEDEDDDDGDDAGRVMDCEDDHDDGEE